MKRCIAVLAFLCTLSARAATVNNDDSCDIAVLPAATLLLPYFEVDLTGPAGGETTIFSITNVTNAERIAHVTLWTDYAYPVFGFDVYLTGYDVQEIDLYDVLVRGVIAPDAGTGTAISQRGRYSDAGRGLDLSHCGRLGGQLDYEIIELLWEAFRSGATFECNNIGGSHDHAVGYATIDVVDACGTAGVTDETYWTKHLRYDNVLTGEYTQTNRLRESAQGEPLVHIRAIPEGGTATRRRITPDEYDAGFARTFYGRFQPADAPRLDGRQPLPSQFAARWVEGGDGEFATSLKIWREGRDADSCANIARVADVDVNGIVLFDENENVIGSATTSKLPATSMTSIAEASVFPPIPHGTASGWAYVDLDERAARLVRPRQGWVISSMRAQGKYATDTTAVAMGNGCSPHVRDAAIGPAPNTSERHGIAATDNDDSCDIGLYPAATLLLPYFDVDLAGLSESTLVSITNVSDRERIARVTLWTDYAFPVLSFNITLGGYDVQSIDLYDVIGLGHLPRATGSCATQVEQLPAEVLMRMELAFSEGIVPAMGDAAGCNHAGGVHHDVVGYATIDVVRNCSSNLPNMPEYWAKDLAYDNVLTGDAQQVSRGDGYAHGSPLVHIRAVPEGGRSEAPFSHTFYSRFQSAATPKRDGRQPLPSRFAARWREKGGWFDNLRASLNIWREPLRAVDATCATYADNAMDIVDPVIFDDAENAFVHYSLYFPQTSYTLPATSRTAILDDDL